MDWIGSQKLNHRGFPPLENSSGRFFLQSGGLFLELFLPHRWLRDWWLPVLGSWVLGHPWCNPFSPNVFIGITLTTTPVSRSSVTLIFFPPVSIRCAATSASSPLCIAFCSIGRRDQFCGIHFYLTHTYLPYLVIVCRFMGLSVSY